MSKGRGRGVIYYNHGQRHLARLVVSLYSLRRHYAGPVTILDSSPAGDRAHEIVAKVVGEKRLGDVECRKIPLSAHRRHSCYCTKASLWRYSPYECFLQADADTLFASDPSPFIDITSDSQPGFTITRFSDWTTVGQIISGRLRQWAGVKCDGLNPKELLRQSLDAPHGAINTGIIGIRKDAKILPAWEKLSNAGWRCSFVDETCSQLLIREYPHTMVDDRWNCSPIYGRNKDKAIIWHFHGNKECRPEALPIWWPVYSECIDRDIGGISEWTPAGDKRLGEYLRQFAA